MSAIRTKGNSTLTLPSPLIKGEERNEAYIRSFWRPPGTPLLFNWRWCVHPMKAGAGKEIAKLESRIAKVRNKQQGPPSPYPLPGGARKKRTT